jgi:hypothetical protein
MTVIPDVVWIDRDSEVAEVSAAKIHVLQLEPIKAKMGEKWERLSSLVHKLFEKTLRQAQGPFDQFLLVDEMSYVVTFHNLSLEEASLACASVAKKVCELLFGAEVDDISVRSLVGPVSPSMLKGMAGDAVKVAEILERHGREIIVTPKCLMAGPAGRPKTGTPWRPGDWISQAHSQLAAAGVGLGFFPVWDLKNHKSSSLFLSAYCGRDRARTGIRRALGGASETQMVEMEIALLNAGAEYAHRVHAAQKLCALGVGVSYQTLSGFQSRIRYIGALKAIRTIPTCPLMLRVEQVPEGTPLNRLAEIVAMLGVANVRVVIEFRSLRFLPQLDIRLGAGGLGGSLKGCDAGTVAAVVQKLARRAAEQKAFAFLQDIDSPELLDIATQNDVRFGSGNMVDVKHCYSGNEPVPNFPLHH